METIIGFVVGYLVGTSQGRNGLAKARESIEAIRNSPETRRLIRTGAAIAGTATRQVLSGGAGAILSGALDSVTRKASDLIGAADARD